MKRYTERQTTMIINSFARIFAHSNIGYMNTLAYKYLITCQGFPKHLSIYGFKAYYSNIELLANDILTYKTNDYGRDKNQCDKIYNEIEEMAIKFISK